MRIGKWIRTTNDNGLPVDLTWETDEQGRDILVIDDEPFQRQYRLEVDWRDWSALFATRQVLPPS